jgi:hypothetical protein
VAQTDTDLLIAQLITGQTTATAGLVERARTSKEPILLVAAALISPMPTPTMALDLMARATACAASTRDRQLVAIATAHLAGDTDRVDALARDHLVDYPDSVLVSWLAASARSSRPDRTPSGHLHLNSEEKT